MAQILFNLPNLSMVSSVIFTHGYAAPTASAGIILHACE